MSTRQDERASRAERRGRRRDDLAARRGGEPETDATNTEDAGSEGDSQLATVAKVAAAGAVVGAAVAAARIAGSRALGGDEESSEEPAALGPADPAAHDGAEASREDPPPSSEPVSDDDGSDDGSTESHPDEVSGESSLENGGGPAGGIIARAVKDLSHLAGHPAEGVLGIAPTDDGWLIEVELVELARIPSTTDVLGAYEVEVGDDGEIRTYRRVRRYVRSQTDTSEEA